MNFNSIIFAIFMGIVFFIYWMISDQYRWMVVLLVSCCFYIGFGIFFFVLLGIVTCATYCFFLFSRFSSRGKTK